MLQVEPQIYFYAALLLLILPLNWFSAAIFAAVFHEICHIAVLWLCKGKIRRIRIGCRGCVMETDRLENWRQILSILAGPAGSLGLLAFSGIMPRLALCGMIHGIYNLIPLLPLDGGRLLQLFLQSYFPERAEQIMTICFRLASFAALAAALWFAITYSAGPLPVLIAVVWNIQCLRRKIPCKPSKIGVQ